MNKKLFLLASLCLGLHFTTAQISGTPPSYDEQQADKIAIYRAEAERVHTLIHTKLDLKFDYKKEHVLGEAWLDLKPHFYPSKQLILDAKAMLIHEVVLIDNNKQKKLKYHNDDNQLIIDLDKTYTRNEPYKIYIKYTARPNEIKQAGSDAITAAKGLYFINADGSDPDKPTQVWTQGETESSSCWFPTIDKPNQKTSQEIYLTYPEKYISLSNGLLKSSKINNDGTKTDYWKFDFQHAPYLFFVGIGDYAIIKDKWKNIEVNYYVEPAYKDYAKDIFGHTPEMLQFFSDLLQYPYPWDKYSQITGRDYISGAMENTGAVLFYENVQQKPGQLIDENIAESIIAHELFHHWFGNLVTAESWSNLLINEAFANYSEYLWFEHKFGKEKAEEHRLDDIESYKMGDNLNKDLVRMHYNSREDVFDAVTYNKGGAITHMLRNYLGDDAFFTGLNHFLNQHKFGKAEAVDLRLALEEVSGKDLNWFFDQWYFGNDHPKLNIAYDYHTQNKKIIVTIKQEGEKLFEFPFTIDYRINGKVHREIVWVGKKVINTFSFDADQKPEVIIPNANEVLLCDLKDNKTIDEFIAQYQAGEGNYGVRKRAIDAFVEAQATNEKALNALIKATQDPYEGLRIMAINKLDPSSQKVIQKASATIKSLAQNDPKTKVQAAAISWLNFTQQVDLSLYETLAKSPSFSVQAAAINGILKQDPSKASAYINTVEDEVISGSPALIANLLPEWIDNNDLSKSKLVAETVAFYAFAPFQDPRNAKVIAQGFEWVMKNDTPTATKRIAKLYSSYYTFLKNENPQASVLIKQMAQNALSIKSNAARENKKLENQVKEIQAALDKMK
ncbi:M1 family metallopeptidase [Weeksella virosa]|uniref:Aminopeptidase N n=1 Tax=Weeksella virosa (strain ATCC 43766 / DSM 16922 / JCM 21250 / CCUG 30538 / CDC 9751 / IAM 14551 / NBRC 16016 / NCTC 11634 / CL345/78) TaxID=865938 RepID=F0NXF9_WEEVC|nr:M1 family metallopeptidase [Weeksella virosa]ADX67949.1 Membrane alanyl aminopeptidase [Weeksella virosa DSM 16922]MDK7674558.1 M1 family metallopeptidase [Weeksella virosa]VEH64417.1 Aminopeptidase N [Weeksella virosa]